MSDSIQARLAALRAEMAKRGIDLYVVSSADFHGSEYIGAYFKTREYLTGFTGSAGKARTFRQRDFSYAHGRSGRAFCPGVCTKTSADGRLYRF